ncbi:MAG: 50S ribosomal protein L18 [Acidimicrobiales bacterium]
MSSMAKKKQLGRDRRHRRVRKKVVGSSQRPRLAVFRSSKHIVAQVIDDVAGVTLASASTHEKDFSDYGGNVEAAKKVGALAAERAKAAGVDKVVFDRGGNRYHGRVKALADAAREAGLDF